MKWLTRANPKIDRLASAWLIQRRVDPDAEFLFAAPPDIDRVAKETGATTYDCDGSELGDVDGRCSFESILLVHKLTSDSALVHMGRIIHGADKASEVSDLPPQAKGVEAILMGYAMHVAGDQERLDASFGMLDALHAWCANEAKQRDRLAAARGRSAS